MSDTDLTQSEADALIAMRKVRADTEAWDYPSLGGTISVPLVSEDKRESFLLDLSRGEINLSKVKYQNRARQVVVLVRLDIGGAPHRNFDDGEIPCPHIHIFRENWSDKWATPVPQDKFPNIVDPWGALQDFMRFCNIVHPPDIRRGVFT